MSVFSVHSWVTGGFIKVDNIHNIIFAIIHIISAFLLITPFAWIIKIIYQWYWWNCKKATYVKGGHASMNRLVTTYNKSIAELSRAQLIEGFLECAPQMLLQLYIVITSVSQRPGVHSIIYYLPQLISICSSWFSVGALIHYYRS